MQKKIKKGKNQNIANQRHIGWLIELARQTHLEKEGVKVQFYQEDLIIMHNNAMMKKLIKLEILDNKDANEKKDKIKQQRLNQILASPSSPPISPNLFSNRNSKIKMVSALNSLRASNELNEEKSRNDEERQILIERDF